MVSAESIFYGRSECNTMAIEIDPIVGNWYENLEKGLKFEVVAVDEDEGLVEVQYFDGDIEEIDLETWYDLEIEPAEAPEDWTGPMDNLDADDMDYTEADMDVENWEVSQQEARPKGEAWETQEPERNLNDLNSDLSEEEP